MRSLCGARLTPSFLCHITHLERNAIACAFHSGSKHVVHAAEALPADFTILAFPPRVELGKETDIVLYFSDARIVKFERHAPALFD